MKLNSLTTEAGAAFVAAASSRENQPLDRTSTDPVFHTGTPLGFAYNVPDGFEGNREIIRSEMMFFNTPLTEKYAAEVYAAIQNIQDQCFADYRNVCPASAPYMNLNRLMAQLLVPMEDQRIYRGRRLESLELKTGADYVDYLRSFFTPFHFQIQGTTHPLSAAVYRDPKTGKMKAADSARDRMPAASDPSAQAIKPTNPVPQVQVRSHAHTVPKVEHHHHHDHRRLSEKAKAKRGRKAAPGWKQPADSTSSAGQSNQATKPTNPEPQAQTQTGSHWQTHSMPKVEHHHHQEHRRLRQAAPGWHQPSTPSAGVHTIEHHHTGGVSEGHSGRLAAPGWTQPGAPQATDKAIKPTNPEPQAQQQEQPRAQQEKEKNPPMAVLRKLREAAPGWHQPTSALMMEGGPAVDVMVPDEARPQVEPAFFRSADDLEEEEMPNQLAADRRPCNKPFQSATEPGQQSALASASSSPSVAGFRPTSLFFSPGGFFFRQQQVADPQSQDEPQQQPLPGQSHPVGGDFRSLIMDFLSGRDVSLSLATPFTISVRTPILRAGTHDDDGGADDDDQAAQDDGYYYSYYNDDGADAAFYDDDGANYAYDDALFLDDDGDGDAVDDANMEDDDDFFAQRFYLPASGALGEKSPFVQVATARAAAATTLQPVVGALKGQARPAAAVRSRLGQRAARRESQGQGDQEDAASSGEEENEEDSDGSEDEGKGDKHDRDHDHDREHRRSEGGFMGIRAQLSSLVHGHHANKEPLQKEKKLPQMDHHDQDHDHHGRHEGGDKDKDKHDHDHDHDRDDPRKGGPHGPPGDKRNSNPPAGPLPYHPLVPVSEDNSFSGNLGFGAEGDMCVYRAMSQGRVSQPCVGAVSELYELRAQYWEESQQPQDFHHHHGLGLLILGVVLLVCMVRRIYAIRYEKKVRSLLTALHTHPHLKSSIEAETGMEVPVPVPAGTCCIGAHSDGNNNGNTLAKAGKVVAFAVLIFAVSFAVSFSSLEITMRVVNEMDKHAPEDPYTGEPAFTSPLAALFVLFFVCTAELTVLALLVRSLKACFQRSADASSADGSGAAASSPSAPFDPRNGPASRSSRLSQHAQQILASLPPALFGRSRPQQAADGYSPLLGEESVHGAHHGAAAAGTEMTSLRMSAYPAQHASQGHGQQRQPQYVPVYVPAMGPVTASPIGAHSINMV